MAEAATRFASIPELVGCLAAQAPNRKLVITLSLVNRTFYVAVRPFLHQRLRLCHPHPVAPLLADEFTRACSRHIHLRSLSVECDEACAYRVTERHLDINAECANSADAFNMALMRALPDMQRLKCFRWKNLLLHPSVLSALHNSCPVLETLDIGFYCRMSGLLLNHRLLRQRDRNIKRFPLLHKRPDVSAFSNLKELALSDLYEKLPWWRFKITEALKNSPGLRKLKLSLSSYTVERLRRIGRRGNFDGFFDRLCDDYGDTGAAPLRLQSLSLGSGLYSLRVESVEKLTDLSRLEEFHISNVDIPKPVGGAYGNGQNAFAVFGPAQCSRLRRYTFGYYSRKLHRFFAKADPSWIRGLAILYQNSGSGEPSLRRTNLDLLSPRYPFLPVNPRMTCVSLDNVLCLPNPGSDAHEPLLKRTPGVQQVLEEPIAGDHGAVEGLAVCFSGLGLEKRQTEMELFTQTVGKLANLSQLVIIEHAWLSRFLTEGDPDPEAWAKGHNRERALEQSALRLAAAAPHLRYLCVYGRYRRVCRTNAGVLLEELDDDEAAQIELFPTPKGKNDDTYVYSAPFQPSNNNSHPLSM